MNNRKIIPVNLRILDKEYVVACPEDERDTLLASVRYLTEKLQEVREGGKVVGNERIVVVSALNIIHEYFQYQQQQSQSANQLAVLSDKIAVALSDMKA